MMKLSSNMMRFHNELGLKKTIDVFAQAGFEAIDFKKKNGYLIGRNFAKEHGFYRQNYCGCEFSRRSAGSTEGKEK